jgi:NAD(P)-dependent dehydrogenase (short-subunit alcohol dehydrogenase family)
MSENTNLTGKVALVTGGGSGLGEATARAFAAAGSTVAVVDRNEEGASRVCQDLADQGHEAMALPCDVSDAVDVQRVVENVAQRLGRLDVAVNCAAVDYVASIEELSVEQWNRVLDVNLSGPFNVARAVFPIMRQQGGGHIVNIASTAAVRAWGNAAAYHASKWGLRGFSRGLGVEGRPYGIRVTTIIPGGMRTHWFDRFPEQGIPMPDEQHLQDPATVAQAIVFAVQVPPESSLQELILTPLTETSWP